MFKKDHKTRNYCIQYEIHKYNIYNMTLFHIKPKLFFPILKSILNDLSYYFIHWAFA